MFSPETYAHRRRQLAEALPSGLALFLGHEESPSNYAGNPYSFRQDSSFLYYWGLDAPGLAGVLDADTGTATLYGYDPTLDETVWTGPQPSMAERAAQTGVQETASRDALDDHLSDALQHGRPIHFLPPYRNTTRRQLEALLGLRPNHVDHYASEALIEAVVAQRSIKSEEEVEQLEVALEVTDAIHRRAMQMAVPGTVERDIYGALVGTARARGGGLSFLPTCSIRGEVLHNHQYGNTLAEGDLLLVDAGATSPMHYAGDVTRVTPVSGRFDARQRAVYEAVLDAQESAIATVEPGVPFKEIHLLSARVLTEHLKDLGLMRGDTDEAVAAGAHALFFPHGLGHMMGLDVHDMEALGEDYVGYGDEQERSEQFGLNALRLARRLQSGFVLTVEPGIYFIPELIARWHDEGRHASFIDYEAVEDFVGFGGVRIEDDVLVTDDGYRVLGPGIPKTPDEVEALAGTA